MAWSPFAKAIGDKPATQNRNIAVRLNRIALMRPILPFGMAARFTFAVSILLAPALLFGQAPTPGLSEPRGQGLAGRVEGRTPDIFFNPTRHAIADAMLQLAGVTAQDVVYDLGSGDGRIPIIAAQKYGARGMGIEIDPRLVTQSWGNANDGQVANRVRFIVGDLFEADLSEATVVTAYLSPSIMKRLSPKLRALKPGTRIVSHQFDMPGWPPDERRQVDEAEILLWRVPK